MTAGRSALVVRRVTPDCTASPVGFVEGIYVSPDDRLGGVGRALVAAGEAWARERGCTEMASDRVLSNEASGAFHESLGYVETVRMACYRKELGRGLPGSSDRAVPEDAEAR